MSLIDKLKPHQKLALDEVGRRLKRQFPVDRLLLFGSVARGEATEESDVDVLVVTQKKMSHAEKHAMVDTVFEINLEYDSNVSILIVNKQAWDARNWTVLPLHNEVSRDGVPL